MTHRDMTTQELRDRRKLLLRSTDHFPVRGVSNAELHRQEAADITRELQRRYSIRASDVEGPLR